MKRRDFFGIGNSKAEVEREYDNQPLSTAALDKLTTPLTRQQAIHLLRRVTFAPTPEQIDSFTGLTPDEAIAQILGPNDHPLPEPSAAIQNWMDTQEENPLTVGNQLIRAEIEGRLRTRYFQFADWWLDLMREETMPATEKLTLFWSSVWCINFNYDTLALLPPALLYRNNQTLRSNRYGDYKKFAEDIAMDGAMNMYQSMYYNTKNAPNENFARELMELFSMGTHNLKTGEANYSEGDIQESTRTLTGWKAAAYEYDPKPKGEFKVYFLPNLHDTNAKTFMNQTIPARDPETENTEQQVLDEEIRNGILRIMFEERSEAIAYFLCSKIYRFFVYSNQGAIDWDFVGELAQIFIDNNFTLRPVFEALFTSEYFFDESIRGIQIKTPPEYIVGLERALGVDYAKAQEAVVNLEQILYNPPNVAGWDAYRTWISTNTYPLRVKYCRGILEAADNPGLVAFAKKFAGSDDIDTLTDALVEYFLPVPIAAERTQRFKQAILDGAGTTEGEWGGLMAANDPNAGEGIRALIEELILSPDFNLS